MSDFPINKSKRIYLIYFFTFFIGIYFMAYTLSVPFISRPVGHHCAPPPDYPKTIKHWKLWKVSAIPYWDQVPKSQQYKPVRPKTQSECFQFTVSEKNGSHSDDEIFEINYSLDHITHCKNGWHFKDDKLSIISQFKLVCDKRWLLQVLPLISSIGFILSTVVLHFENYIIILSLSTILMLSSSVSICLVYDITLLFVLKFLSSFLFGTNFYVILTLMKKFKAKTDMKSIEIIFLAGLLGSVCAKGMSFLMIYTIKDWKIIQILTSFTVIPIIIFGIILFIIHATDTEHNINFVDELEDQISQQSIEESSEQNPRISAKIQLFLLWITAFLYFCEDLAQHQKLENNHKLFDPTFIMIQTFNVLMIFISKRKISLKYTILLALICVSLSNTCNTFAGIFEFKYEGIFKKILEYMNKIGVSIAFYANLFIFIEFMDKRNTAFNLILVNVIMFSYGLSPLALKFNEINSWLIRIFLAITSLAAIIVLIIKCFISDKVLNTPKPIRHKTIFYSVNNLNEDKLYIVNESLN